MKIVKKVLFLVLAISLVLAVFNVAGANAQVIKMRYGLTIADPDKHPSGLAGKVFIKEMEKRVGDMVEITMYPGGQLGKSTEAILGGVLMGAAELMDFNLGSYAEYTKAFTPLEAPYLVATFEEAHKLLDGEAGQIMKQKAIDDAGLRVIAYWDNGFRHITNSVRPIITPSDAQGLKIRVMNNPVYLSLMREFNALPTPMAFTELYTALQQGVVDGQENPIATIEENKIYEIQKYMTLTNHTFGASSLVMSEEYYQGLPEDIRKAIDESAAIAQEASREILAGMESELLEFLKTKVEVTELSPEQLNEFREVAKGSWDAVREIAGAEYFDEIVSYVD